MVGIRLAESVLGGTGYEQAQERDDSLGRSPWHRVYRVGDHERCFYGDCSHIPRGRAVGALGRRAPEVESCRVALTLNVSEGEAHHPVSDGSTHGNVEPCLYMSDSAAGSQVEVSLYLACRRSTMAYRSAGQL